MPPPSDPEEAASNDELLATQRLLERYKSDDLEALGQLFERYYPRVLQVVRSRVGPQMRAKLDVEDAVQQVFVDALRGLDKFDYRGPGSFMNWLATVAVNRMNSEHKRLNAALRDVKRERALESLRAAANSGNLAFEPAADITAVSDRAGRAEELELMMGALDQLPSDLRRGLELRWLLGCTLPEVAQEMGLPNEMSAHRLCTRARVELGRLISGPS
ncbi:MAG: RNA polymerase sigma factor [Planctomycetota bacterium]|jgi:RNA polymerase sigma-70 factor (ECF subfamily)